MMAFMFANAIAPAVVAEGATVAMTAAEIAAIEAAAAHAAQVAAAQTLAAEQAAALAAEQAVAASTASNAGIMGVELGASATPTAETAAAGIDTVAGAGAESANAAQMAQQQAEIARQGLSNTPLTPDDPAQLEQMRQAATGAENLAQNAPVIEQTAGLNTKGTMYEGTFLDRFNNPSSVTDETLRAGYGSAPLAAPPVAPPAAPSTVTASKFPLYGSNLPAQQAGAVPPPAESGFMKGISSAMDYMDKNPFKSSIGAYGAAQKLGLFDQEKPEKKSYDGILSKYKMSPDFKGRSADPEDYQYTPKMYNMASGGIASYKRGGDLSSQLDHYEKMAQTKAAPAGRGDPGIVFDTDPDTRSLDPLTAAQVRMAKVNKRANLQVPGMKRPTPMGQLNLVPVTMKKSDESSNTVDAAQGGVMSLGGYAAGGNPRLLRGPGDGMSDNIPATIAGKQPARLADGEFVIPADVVSHLGNGSTEAGAKKLHKMMNDVRKARTGNPKQGKQINPNKFMPK